jgi:hypothetical protein
MNFTARRDARTDNANTVFAAVRVSDKQEPLLYRHSDCHEAILIG